jgi:hypothetical protein
MISFSGNESVPPEKAMIEDFDLDLTLATGVSKQKKPTNLVSEETMPSSTSVTPQNKNIFSIDYNLLVDYKG